MRLKEVRLQKYLAYCEIASRRRAEDIIKQGRVTVNNSVVTEMGVKVRKSDIVKVDGKEIFPVEEMVYIMLNKPEGYVSTVKDQFGRPSVIDLVKTVKKRLYPVGRLDYNTSGLILLTNDGDFTHRVTHPSHKLDKVYLAEIKGFPDNKRIRQFENGLIVDNYKTSPAEFNILSYKDKSSIVKIIIHEGRNRQIRKMCRMINHPVIRLKRIAIGNLKIGNLPEGKWKYINDKQIKDLLA